MEKKINSSEKEIMHNKFAKIDFGNGLQRNRRTREIKRERTVSMARLLICQTSFFFAFCCLRSKNSNFLFMVLSFSFASVKPNT